MNKPDIHRLLEFQRLLFAFQMIKRVDHFPGSQQAENDVEHSYTLAMTAWFLASFFPGLNRDKVIRLAMAHDIVEVHAGDTYIYADEAMLETKPAREAAAFKQLQADWPDFPDMLQAIEDYEQRDCEEAKFVYALDKIMPIMLIYLAEGYTWQKEGISHAQLHQAKHRKVASSPEINDYYQQLHELLLASPHFFAKP